jgi:hypothetical protein
VGITFSRLAFSYWIDYLGFITEGKLAAIFIKHSLGVSNWPVIYYTFPCQLGTRSFLSPLPGIEEEAPTPSSPRHHATSIEVRLEEDVQESNQRAHLDIRLVEMLEDSQREEGVGVEVR